MGIRYNIFLVITKLRRETYDNNKNELGVTVYTGIQLQKHATMNVHIPLGAFTV